MVGRWGRRRRLERHLDIRLALSEIVGEKHAGWEWCRVTGGCLSGAAMLPNAMNGLRPQAKNSKILILVGIVIIAGALHVAREVFIPIAVAALLSFLLAPMVNRLTRWGLPNLAAVLTTVGFAFTILGVVGWLVSAQFVNLVNELPKYQDNMRAKISAISEPGEGVFSRAGEMVRSLRREIEEEANEEAAAEQPDQPAPVPVQVEEPPPGPFKLLAQYAGPVLGPLGLAGISFIFVVFILLQRNDLRDRFVKLVSGGNLNLATQAVDDATQRITRYLLMQMVINVTYGIPLGVGLYFIGVPNALLWGLLATLLRFIPFVGPWVAAFFPISLSIAVDPGWTMPLMVIGLVIALELISNNVIEPWLYGTSTGISVVALLFAAVVWTWIWGPIGLFLSTPLTVCLLVIGKNVPSLGFLNVILGSEPVLAPEARLYQRMLAMDPESMFDLADDYLESHSLTGFYDRVLVPALAMAEGDRHAGTLAERRQQFIIQSTRDLIEDLAERFAEPAGDSKARQVICFPAQDEADELTALMFGQVLKQSGISSEIGTTSQPVPDVIRRARETGAKVICICSLPPGAVAAARKKCRRLHQAGRCAKVMAGVWDTTQSATAIEKRLAKTCPDLVATTFADAEVQIENALQTSSPMMPAPIPGDEARRLEEIKKLTLLDTPPEEMYDAITRKLAEAFKVPISLVTIVDADRQFWKSQVGLPDDLAKARESPRATSVCGHVVARNELLVVEDVAKDDRFANNPFVKERGIRFYAGAPLRTRSGHVVGSLCVIDMKPRTISDEQKWLLQSLAKQLMGRAQATDRKKRRRKNRHPLSRQSQGG